ncbi:hypothetical protein ACIQTO_30440, partial [Kitasatospora sp. NPDC091207]
PDRRPKGTPVMVPPPDFNPFAPLPPDALTPAAPEAAPTAVQAVDPFGTVTVDQPNDPFGTTLPQQAAPVPPPPSAPPTVPAPTVTLPTAGPVAEDAADDPDRRPKGTPVMVPPPDFNPFAPLPPDALTPAAPEAAPTAAPETSPFG